jgi:DNA-binding NarL/FixJ family response regulator
MSATLGRSAFSRSFYLAARISLLAQAALTILFIPSYSFQATTSTIGQLTLCSLLAIPAFLPFLFPDIYHRLNRIHEAGSTKDAYAPALAAVLLCASFLPGICNVLITVVAWPAIVLVFPKNGQKGRQDCPWPVTVLALVAISVLPSPIRAAGPPVLLLAGTLTKKEANEHPETASPIQTPFDQAPSAALSYAIFFIVLQGITLAESQFMYGPGPTNLIQANVSLILVAMGALPLALMLWRSTACSRVAAALICLGIIASLARGYSDQTFFKVSILLATTWAFLLFKALLVDASAVFGRHRNEGKRLFYALCALPIFTSMSHMLFATSFLSGEEDGGDQASLLFGIMICVVLCIVALFLKLSTAKIARQRSECSPDNEDRVLDAVAKIEAAAGNGMLADRELEVVSRLYCGMSLADIAKDLDVSKSTAATYAQRAYVKLGAADKQEALSRIEALVSAESKGVTATSGREERAVATMTPRSQIRLALLDIMLAALAFQLVGLVSSSPLGLGAGTGNLGIQNGITPIALALCFVLAMAAMGIFGLLKSSTPSAAEMFCAALLPLTLAYRSFVQSDATEAAWLLRCLLSIVAAACCLVCLMAIAQRCEAASRRGIIRLVAVAAGVLVIEQISLLKSCLEIAVFASVFLVTCFCPLKTQPTRWFYSTIPPLETLVACSGIGLSIQIVVCAAGSLAQQNSLAGPLFTATGVFAILGGAVALSSFAKAMQAPIYPPVTICAVTAFPGLLFASPCITVQPKANAAFMLICGIMLFVACAQIIRRGVGALVMRRKLATSLNDSFLQKALLRYGLTGTEAHIATLAARGLTAMTIAKELTVSQNTVRTHIRHVYLKLDVHSKVELTQKAIDLYRREIDRI